MNYNEYNTKCNKYLTSNLIDKYKIYFYNDINYQNYLILEYKEKKISCVNIKYYVVMMKN